MAKIVIITHEFDAFFRRRGWLLRKTCEFLIYDVMVELQRRGHELVLQQGTGSGRASGDVALLHVDRTVVPGDYLDYAKTFPLCLNIATADISKRKISGALLSRGDDWAGAVIVKTDLNNGGFAERRHHRHALRAGKSPDGPCPPPTEYRTYESLCDVPASAFADPALIVERFLAEPEPDGFATRFWIFCGDRGRCARYVSSSRIGKASSTLRSEEVEVPDGLRAMREKLGFDYGKFDFVIHDGRAILLDANRTPGRPRNLIKRLAEGAPALADGFEQLIREKI